jgi:hypothetical protein
MGKETLRNALLDYMLNDFFRPACIQRSANVMIIFLNIRTMYLVGYMQSCFSRGVRIVNVNETSGGITMKLRTH